MKTHQEKLNELTTEIRKSIPRLMELSDGCHVKLYYKTTSVVFFKSDKNIGFYTLGKFDEIDILTHEEFTDDIEYVFGKEPLLNDVLEWHSLNGRCKYSHFEVSKGEAYFSIYDGEENESINWDLSKLKLSDQSEELIDFLHDLIKLT